jgi:hypothetical protein
MTRNRKSAVKILLLSWLVFAPYYLWLFVSLLKRAMPPRPWPAVIFFSYWPIGIAVVMMLAKKIKN